MIKGNFNEEIPKKIKYILYELTKSVYNEIRVSMDTNPNNIWRRRLLKMAIRNIRIEGDPI